MQWFIIEIKFNTHTYCSDLLNDEIHYKQYKPTTVQPETQRGYQPYLFFKIYLLIGCKFIILQEECRYTAFNNHQ